MYLLILLAFFLILYLAQRQVEGFCDCQGCSKPCNCANCPYSRWLGQKSVSYEGFHTGSCTGEVGCECPRCVRLRPACGRFGYPYRG